MRAVLPLAVILALAIVGAGAILERVYVTRYASPYVAVLSPPAPFPGDPT